MTRILVVDDEPLIVESIKDDLEKEGYTIIAASDGEQALVKMQTETPDLVLLDVRLPKKDGWAVCLAIREYSRVPIIMLTASGDDHDKVIGLELGADDYLVKPFSTRELVARVHATLRRATEYVQAPLQMIAIGAIRLDVTGRRVTRDGRLIDLTRKEYELLRALMSQRGKVIARNDLIDQVWHTDWVGNTRTLDVHIRWLREKIEQNPGRPVYIQTVRGVGYRFATRDEINGEGTPAHNLS